MINTFNIFKNKKLSLPCADTGPNLTVVPGKFEPKTFVGCATGAAWFVPNIEVPIESKNSSIKIKSSILLFISYLLV